MYFTLTGITNGQSIQLLHTIDNSAGQLEVALCDVTYYPRWTNINAARYNNWFLIGNFGIDHTCIVIPNRYYSICSLNDEIVKPNGISLAQNESNVMLKLSTGEENLLLLEILTETLGFDGRTGNIPPNNIVHGIRLPNLVPYKELCIHLDQISTTDNIQLESPSTLLRAIPVRDEKYNSRRTESFSQYYNIKN